MNRISVGNLIQIESQIRELNAIAAEMRKTANIGGDQETQFEQAFASLAYTYIKDKAPRLLDHMVGFQLIDRNDDNTKAAGIFGYRVGKTWLYSPVFFLNGELKGHELLYLKAADRFVPLAENWVNYVISREPQDVGQGVTGTLRDNNVQTPNILPLSTPPHNRKYGSVRVFPNLSVGGWLPPAAGIKEAYAAITQNSLADAAQAVFSKCAGPSCGEVLKELLSSSYSHCKQAVQICHDYPGIAQCFDDFYGKDFFANVVETLREKSASLEAELSREMGREVYQYHFNGKNRKRPRKVLSRPEEPRAKSVLDNPEWKRASAAHAVLIRTKQAMSELGRLGTLTTKEAEAMAANGYLIEDRRDTDEVSQVFSSDLSQQLTNPDSTGVYKVLTRPGEFTRSLVLSGPYADSGRKNAVTVVAVDGKEWLNAHSSHVFVQNAANTVEEYDKWYESLSSSDKLSVGSEYLLVTKNRDGTTPFTVTDDYGDDRYGVRFHDWADLSRPGQLEVPRREQSFSGYGSSDASLLYLSDRNSHTLRLAQGILYAPAAHKVIKLPELADRIGSCSPCSADDGPSATPDASSKKPPFALGSLEDLQTELLRKTSSLRVYASGCEASVNGSPLQPQRQCLFDLVLQHGLREKDAKAVLQLADYAAVRNDHVNLRVHYGPDYPLSKKANPQEFLGPGPGAPAIPEPSFGYDQSYGGVPTQYPEEFAEPVPELDPGLTDPNIYNPLPENMPDPMLMQQAQQAGQGGRKEVFEAAMLSGLLRTSRPDSRVSQFSGDLLLALDRIGRTLALFYWHNDEFIERYGKTNAPELEDALRNSFETLGDLVLFLKEKDVQPLRTGIRNDPDVEQAALN